MSEEIFAYGTEGGKEEFLKNVIPFCENESKMFCLIGDLPVSNKSLILEPWKISNCYS